MFPSQSLTLNLPPGSRPHGRVLVRGQGEPGRATSRKGKRAESDPSFGLDRSNQRESISFCIVKTKLVVESVGIYALTEARKSSIKVAGAEPWTEQKSRGVGYNQLASLGSASLPSRFHFLLGPYVPVSHRPRVPQVHSSLMVH